MTSELQAPPRDELLPADAVVGVTACATGEAAEAVTRCVMETASRWSPPLRLVLVLPNAVVADPGTAGAPGGAALQRVGRPLALLGRLPLGPSEARDLFEPLAGICRETSARACVILGSRADTIAPTTVHTLLAPVLEEAIDVVCPNYPRHRLDGLINTGIVYPLTRALYGKRVDGQLGIDFGFSTSLLAAIAGSQASRGEGRPIWPLTEAVTRGMAVAQGNLDRWAPPVETPTDTSTALAQVLGPLFLDMELHAATWQRTRGAQPVPVFGTLAPAAEEDRMVDVAPMVESFVLGLRSLQDVWSRLLTPATLVELNRLARGSAEEFRMSDRLWARVVFDFALGHRLRVLSRDHLLRALTPIYLAWAASFVGELKTADAASARLRVERLCGAYEAEKPYLVSRWRWPDRFNP
jgi:hypothetical protein